MSFWWKIHADAHRWYYLLTSRNISYSYFYHLIESTRHYKTWSMFMCVPACSQIWARVIQGCRGPCLGALLCREEATSDRACSTRLAAMDVAWTEPGGRESNHHTHTRASPRGTGLLLQHSSVRQPCATMQGFNSTKHISRFHWFTQVQREKGNLSVKSGVFGCSEKTLGPHWHTVSCSCTEAFKSVNTIPHAATHSVMALDEPG